MNKKNLFFLAFFCCLLQGRLFAQDSTSVASWDFSAQKTPDGYTLILHGKIKDGWKLYSTTMKDDL
ncbi:MAG: hypothetical protein ABUM51_02305, partial [Bacteroidota bacterium]